MIAPEPFFTPRGTPFSVYYRTTISSELGHSIDLLTYGQGQDPDIPGVRLIRIPGFRRFGSIKVGPSPFKLFLDMFLVLYTIGLLIRHRYDVVHTHEEAVFFCRFLKPLFRFKLIYDMHSSLPQQLTNFEFTTSKVLIGTFRLLENSCLKKADAIITICPDLAKYVDGLLNHPDKHFLIENSVFDPIRLKQTTTPQGPAAPEQQLPAISGPCVVYAGTLEAYQGIDILIPAFQIFHRDHSDYQLLIVGGTPQQVQKYQEMAKDCGVGDSCIFTGQVSQDRAKEYSSKADILVSPRKSGTNTPLKIYEQLASGKPLVATRIYSHTQVLTDDVAVLVEPTPEQMAEGLAQATNSAGMEKARKARQLYAERYSRKIYTAKVRRMFDYLSQQPRI